ncbi:MAG TPA: thioesterase family protein [Pirellulales bacterium]
MTLARDPAPQARFQHALVVQAAEIDANRHANNIAYLRWVQDAAVAHWLAAVEPELARGMSWVVVRHEIDYKQPAYLGDALVVQTWIGAITAATTERLCEIVRPADNQLLARARTIWCALDPQTGRPRRIDQRIREAFLASPSSGA